MAERKGATRAASKGGFKLPPLPKGPPPPTFCGKQKRQGGKCMKGAGWGTDHPGFGACKLHGGAMKNHSKAAIKAEAKLMGAPYEMNPYEALTWCISITAGEVKWLSEQMAILDKKDWTENTIAGKQFHLYAKTRADRIANLARYSERAIGLGIAERAVKLYEQYGETLAMLIQGILGDLDLNAEQRAKAPQIVRKHLILVSSQTPEEIEHHPLALAAGEA